MERKFAQCLPLTCFTGICKNKINRNYKNQKRIVCSNILASRKTLAWETYVGTKAGIHDAAKIKAAREKKNGSGGNQNLKKKKKINAKRKQATQAWIRSTTTWCSHGSGSWPHFTDCAWPQSTAERWAHFQSNPPKKRVKKDLKKRLVKFYLTRL